MTRLCVVWRHGHASATPGSLVGTRRGRLQDTLSFSHPWATRIRGNPALRFGPPRRVSSRCDALN
jgi:hypothetical protein